MPDSRTDAVLAAIDGALADEELPDAMRWAPEPEKVTDAGMDVFDGACVPLPPQQYEREDYEGPNRMRLARRDGHYEGPGGFPLVTTRRGGIRYPGVSQHASGLAMDHPPARGEVVQRNGWRFRDSRYLPEPVTPARVAELLLVQETGPGSVRVSRLDRTRPLTAEEAAAIIAGFGAAFERVFESLAPVFRAFGEAWADLIERFADFGPHLGPLVPPASPSTPEEIRARALDLRRTRHAGPPRPGPEQSRSPRRLIR